MPANCHERKQMPTAWDNRNITDTTGCLVAVGIITKILGHSTVVLLLLLLLSSYLHQLIPQKHTQHFNGYFPGKPAPPVLDCHKQAYKGQTKHLSIKCLLLNSIILMNTCCYALNGSNCNYNSIKKGSNKCLTRMHYISHNNVHAEVCSEVLTLQQEAPQSASWLLETEARGHSATKPVISNDQTTSENDTVNRFNHARKECGKNKANYQNNTQKCAVITCKLISVNQTFEM